MLFTGDLVFLRGVLGAVTHWELVVIVEQSIDDERVAGLEVAERRALAREEEAVG